MRKIEQQMIKAIKERRDWKSGNTRVWHSSSCTWVSLYGHVIADMVDRSLHITLANHNTATTRSRLTALCREFAPDCCGVGTKRGQASIVYRDRQVKIENDTWAVV